MFIQFLYVLTSSCSWAISTLAALESKARSPYSQPPEEWSRICSPGNSGWWVHQMVEYFYHLLWGNPVKPGHGWFIMLHHASVWLRWLGLGIGRTCRPSSNYSSQCPRNPNPHRRILKAKKDLGVTAPASSKPFKFQKDSKRSNLFESFLLGWDPLGSIAIQSSHIFGKGWEALQPAKGQKPAPLRDAVLEFLLHHPNEFINVWIGL